MQIAKKKAKRSNQSTVPLLSKKATICGACGYKRKASDVNPDWQCPCCKAAYVKVSKSGRFVSEDLKKEAEDERKSNHRSKLENVKKVTTAKGMAAVGTSGLLQGIAKSCTGIIISNPIIFSVGALVLVGAALYYASTLSGAA